jgi:Tetratricopeptide repeat
VTRLADLLEDDPGVEADLRALVQEIQAQLPTGMVSAADHGVAAGRDVNITASAGGVAGGTIHGDVSAVNPSQPGLAGGVAAPGADWALAAGSVGADRGGVAVGRVEYQRRPELASHPVRLAPRPVFLAGREELLTDLDARLTGGDGPGPRIVVLSGLGGAGKTSVALEYAHRHLAEVGVAWQFASEDPAVLSAGFGELAAQLGARDLLDTRDPVASVHAVLAALAAGWLLVFDIAADRASVQAFLPPAGRGQVLVTSRDPFWPPGQVLEVQVLDREVAAGFLGNRTGDADRQAALELADELGGLPLALEQAAAYIQATGDSLSDFLDSFRRRRPEMLARGEPAGYGSTVLATWSLAFGRLEQSAPGAAGLLRLLACCAPDAVPLRLLLQPRPWVADQLGQDVAPVLGPLLEDQLAARDAIAALRRYSLVSPPADGVVSVHRLVQAVTLDQMPAGLAAAWRQAAAAVIEAAIPDDPLDPQTWPVFAALLSHAQEALTPDSAGAGRMASYVGHSGNYAAALSLCQRGLAARERAFGPDHPGTLDARKEVASWTGEAGDAAAARDQYAALLPVRERVLGPEHPDTLTDRSSLARWTGEAGDAAAARDQFAALLPIRERVQGPDHPATLTTRANLAYWIREADGDADSGVD